MFRIHLLVIALATACQCGRLSGNDWPLRVTLGADVEGSPATIGAPDSPVLRLRIDAGVHGASEVFLADGGDMVLVDLEEGPHWVRAPAPLDAARLAFIRGLATEGTIHVRFFADGDRAIVTAEPGIMAVQLSTGRVRMLDHRAGTLEGCSMEAGRETFRCSLDLSWGSALFDADGRELNGSFDPAWL